MRSQLLYSQCEPIIRIQFTVIRHFFFDWISPFNSPVGLAHAALQFNLAALNWIKISYISRTCCHPLLLESVNFLFRSHLQTYFHRLPRVTPFSPFVILCPKPSFKDFIPGFLHFILPTRNGRLRLQNYCLEAVCIPKWGGRPRSGFTIVERYRSTSVVMKLHRLHVLIITCSLPISRRVPMFVMTIGFHYHIIIHDVVYLLDVPDLSLWNRVALCSRIYIYIYFFFGATLYV